MYCIWHRLRNLRRIVLRGNNLKRLPLGLGFKVLGLGFMGYRVWGLV